MLERFAGRFLLLRRLGQGGMGEVFLARDLTTGLECALKRLRGRAADGILESSRREFEAHARVRHPVLVSVYEFGVSPEGVPFCAMEYVPGVSAERAVTRGDWAALCFVGARVARGLEALHRAGVFHGDIKPGNLLMIPGESAGDLPRSVRLVDFGLAVLAGESQGGHTGTPGFAAPEVVSGQVPSQASDLYSLGATLYSLACGRPAFEADSVSATLQRQLTGPPSSLPLEEAGAPPALVDLLFRLLSPEKNERPSSAREVRRELERIHPAARRPLADQLQAVVVVGRERELARLDAWMERGTAKDDDRSREATAHVMVVQGEAGAGKSSLLSEFGSRAALAGSGVVSLSCGTLEGLGSLIRPLVVRWASQAGVNLDEAVSSPTSQAALAGTGPVVEADLDELAMAAASWAAHGGRRQLVLLDDSERLDPISRAWIRKLACREPHAAIHWVLARRPVEAETDEDALLLKSGYAERLQLFSLDRGGITRIAAARLGDVPPDELVEFLWSKAAGHAGLTIELLRAAAAAGAVIEDDAGLRAIPEKLAALGVPADFESSLLARFESLPADARALAEALAIAGLPLDPEGLRRLAPAADDAAFSLLRASGLARELENRAWLIWPPAIGERLAVKVNPDDARRLHRAALDLPGLSAAERFRHLREAGDLSGALGAAEDAVKEAPDDRLAATAAELAEGSSAEEAARWHERTARFRMARRRYAAAIPHVERALELEPTGAARADRWAALVTCLLNSGRHAQAGAAVQAALAEGLPPEVRARVLVDDAARLSMLGRLDEASEGFAIAERAAAAADNAQVVALAAEGNALIHLFKGRLAEAAAGSKRARVGFERTDNSIGQIRLLVLDAAIARARGNLDQALKLHEKALLFARERNDRLGIETALDRLSLAQSQAGLWREAVENYREVFRVAVEDGRPGGAAIALANLAYMSGMMGDSRRALRASRRAGALLKSYWPRARDFGLRTRSQALRISGHARRARAPARFALRLASNSSVEEQDWCRLELARTLAATGNWPAAAEVLDPFLNLIDDSSMGAAIGVIFSARALLRLGQLEKAKRKLAGAEAWLENHVSPHASAFAELLRCELAIARNDFPAIQETGQRALAAFEALHAAADRATAAYDIARLARDRPEVAPSVLEWLEIAQRGFQRLGNRRDRERALSLLVEKLRATGRTVPAIGSTDERGLIERVSWLIGSISDLGELSQRAMRMVVEQLEAERGVLLLLDQETGQMSVIAEQGVIDPATRREALGYSRRIVERVTKSGGSVLAGDAPSDPRLQSESIETLGLQSILAVPLFFGSLVVGAVYLDDSRGPDRFDEHDRGLLEGFAHLMAVALMQAQGHEETERAKKLLEDENLSLRQEVGSRFQYQDVVGGSSQMKRVLATVEHAARANTTVLLTGENGTGKELIARTLHHAGNRRRGPFVVVNCGAIPEALLESELFGILPNVATGVRARDGRFVQASGGTLFLDEVGEMPLNQQVALLSAIANREITPVGGGKPIKVDVRIVTATNRDLRKLVELGQFREDLYFRLNVLEINVPPLRDRKSDIPALANYFLNRFCLAQERPLPEPSPDFMAVLMQSDWAGNVRELQNYIERVLAMSTGPILRPDPLPRDLQDRGMIRPSRGRPLADTVDDVERRMVKEALKKAEGNQSQAARLLGLTEQSLRYRIRKYGMGGARQNRRTRRK